MLENNVIDAELRRLIKVTMALSGQVVELTARLEALEAREPVAAQIAALPDLRAAHAPHQ